MRRSCVLLALLFLLFGATARADTYSPFPGLNALVEKAQSIVILRVGRLAAATEQFRSSAYHLYECSVYQTIKGDVATNKPLRLDLADFHVLASKVLPEVLPEGSTWLVFLLKDGAEYRSLAVVGSLVQVSPTGQEKEPEGKNVGEKVRNVLKAAVEYRRREYEREQAYLQKLLEGKPDSIEGKLNSK